MIKNPQKYIDKNKRGYVLRKKRLKTDKLFKLSYNVGGLIRNSFKRSYGIKAKKTIDILGCSYEQFKVYIEKQFDTTMTWENYGYWVLDHKKPIASAKNETDVYMLNHYTNFQPLTKDDNGLKSSFYDENHPKGFDCDAYINNYESYIKTIQYFKVNK